MPQSIFTTETPANGDLNDGVVYALGQYFTPAVNGTITHIRWYFPTSGQPGGAAVLAGLYRVSDSVKLSNVTDAAFASPGTPGAWNQVALSPTVAVTGGVELAAVIRTPGQYVSTGGVSSPLPVTNGDLTAPGNGGRFLESPGSSTAMPVNTFNNSCYFVDVVFVPDGEDEPQVITPSGVAVPVALGPPALAQSLAVTPGGISIPVALGGPTLSQGNTLPAGGLAVPVALGPPSLAWSGSLAAGGLAVPVALGSTGLTWSGALAVGGLAVPASLGAPTLSQTLEPSFEIAAGALRVPIGLGSVSLSQPPARVGSWNSLLGIVREARADHVRNREREANPIDCPEHGWPLELTPKGRHCKFGGHLVT